MAKMGHVILNVMTRRLAIAYEEKESVLSICIKYSFAVMYVVPT